MSSLSFEPNSHFLGQNTDSHRAGSPFKSRSQSRVSRTDPYAASFMSRRSSSARNRNNYVISEIKYGNYQNPSSTSSNMLKVALLVIGAIAIIYLMNKAYADGRAAGEAAGHAAGEIKGYAAGRTAGYDAGRAAVRTAGYDAGRAAVRTAGYDAGRAAGRKGGYDEGHAVGHAAGYNIGYDAGRLAGLKRGKSDGDQECISKTSEAFNKGIEEGIKQAESAFRKSIIGENEPIEHYNRPLYLS